MSLRSGSSSRERPRNQRARSRNWPILPLAQPSPVRLKVETGNLIPWEAKQMFWKNKPLRTRTHHQANRLWGEDGRLQSRRRRRFLVRTIQVSAEVRPLWQIAPAWDVQNAAPGPVFVSFDIHRRRRADGTTHGRLDDGVSTSRAPLLPRWLMIASGEAITTDESCRCSSIYREQLPLRRAEALATSKCFISLELLFFFFFFFFFPPSPSSPVFSLASRRRGFSSACSPPSAGKQ